MNFEEYILEMAAKQKNAVNKIEDILPITQRHIYKCLLMPNSTAINHHIKDVSMWLSQMNTFADTKTKRARPKCELLLKEYEAKFASRRLNSLVDDVIDDYELDLRLSLAEKENLHEFVREYFGDFFLDIENDAVNLPKQREILRKKVEELRKL